MLTSAPFVAPFWCALDAHLCWAHNEASTAADFTRVAKAALRHKIVDYEEDRKGLEWDLGQGHFCSWMNQWISVNDS